MKKVTAICPQCGKEFQYFPSQYRGKPKEHCSKKCWSDAAWLQKECAWCNSPFVCRRSDPTECCSKTCARRLLNKDNHITFQCDQCGKSVTRKLSNYAEKGQTAHFCSRACHALWQKEHTPDHIVARRDCREKRICKECGKDFDIVPSAMRRKNEGSFCSNVCKGKYYAQTKVPHLKPAARGPLNINWKGGYKKYYGESWREQRRQARKRDGYTCFRCGITEIDLGIELDVHHIRPFREFGVSRHKEANNLDNLISLCNYCHKRIEPRGCIKP